MTREEIIQGLKFTVDMVMFDPATGETRQGYELNDMDKTTVEACKGAMELLRRKPQTDSDLISRAAAKEIIAKTDTTDGYRPVFSGRQVIALLDDLPSIKQEQKTGHWINEDVNGLEYYRCSECQSSPWDFKTKCCPDCGAKMEV